MAQVFYRRHSHIPSKICSPQFCRIDGKYHSVTDENLTFAAIRSNESITKGISGS